METNTRYDSLRPKAPEMPCSIQLLTPVVTYRAKDSLPGEAQRYTAVTVATLA